MVSQMVIGPGSVNLSARVVWARVKRASLGVHAALARDRPGHRRHVDDVAVVADAHLGLLLPSRCRRDVLEEAVHEVDAELLAVGDDIDAGVLLRS